MFTWSVDRHMASVHGLAALDSIGCYAHACRVTTSICSQPTSRAAMTCLRYFPCTMVLWYTDVLPIPARIQPMHNSVTLVRFVSSVSMCELFKHVTCRCLACHMLVTCLLSLSCRLLMSLLRSAMTAVPAQQLCRRTWQMQTSSVETSLGWTMLLLQAQQSTTPLRSWYVTLFLYSLLHVCRFQRACWLFVTLCSVLDAAQHLSFAV